MKNRVKYLRRGEKYDMTQEELASALGVSRVTISNMELGAEPSGRLVLKISRFFDMDAREIFFEDDVV